MYLNKRKSIFFLAFDVFIVIFSFVILAWVKPATIRIVLPKYYIPFAVFWALWIVVSIVIGKYGLKKEWNFSKEVRDACISNLIVLAISLSLLMLLHITDYSRLLIFGTVAISTVLEIAYLWVFNIYSKTNRLFYYEAPIKLSRREVKDQKRSEKIKEHFSDSIKEGIVKLTNEKVYSFIEETISYPEQETFFTSTRCAFNIQNKMGSHNAIVNIQNLNTVHDYNQLFNAVNEALPIGGEFFTIAETIFTRKKRIMAKYPWGLNRFIYVIDYLFNRVFAKSYPTRYIYQKFVSKNKAISKAELLGRLYASGFEVVVDAVVDGEFLCVCRKVSMPKVLDNEAIGGLIKLKRFGKDKKVIGVYKFRTMHAYSEYIQSYVYEKNSLDEKGKIKDDFRINTTGKFMRKSWLDEFPMFINILKGEMKLIGVRPLSEHFFGLYTKELQDFRTKFKPGLLPPYYADMPEGLDEIMASEMKYLKEYEKKPFATDLKYLFMIFNNIVIKKNRSK